MAVRRLAEDAVILSLLLYLLSCVSSPLFFCANKISKQLMDLTDGLTFQRASAWSLLCLFVRSRLNSAALFFWDSPLRRVSLPSEILRRHAEMLCHRRLIRLPEPALTVPPLQYCLVPWQISVKLKIRRCLGHPVQGGLHPYPWIGRRGARWPAREQLPLLHSSRLLPFGNEFTRANKMEPPGS